MGKKAKERNDEPVIENRKARHDYEILETLEVGIVLRGDEVKAIRSGRASIAEGYIRASETPPALNLHSVTIEEYRYAAPHKASSHRIRVLLAHKREILKLAKEANVKGMTIVPLKMYFKDGYAKLLIGLGKGRSSHDKRDAIGKREAQRDMQRAMSRRAR
jgi:SsrA-binding protein